LFNPGFFALCSPGRRSEGLLAALAAFALETAEAVLTIAAVLFTQLKQGVNDAPFIQCFPHRHGKAEKLMRAQRHARLYFAISDWMHCL